MTHLRRMIGLLLAGFVLLAILMPGAATRSFADIASLNQATQEPTQAATPAVAVTVAANQSATQAPPQASAQGVNAVTVEGSQIVSPILKSAADSFSAKNPGTTITVNASGTVAGFDKLCSGTADMAMAVESITDEQDAACKAKNVNYIETLLGFNALDILVNGTSTLTCLTPDQANKLLSPSSTALNWNAVDSSLGNVPITAIYSPPADSKAVALAGSLVPGGKIRADVKALDSTQKVGDQFGTEANTVGIMTAYDFNTLNVNSQTVKALQMKTNASAPCVDSGQANLEAARYPYSQSLYLYVNAASLARKPVSDFLSSIFQDQQASLVLGSGFTSASTTTYDRDQHYLDIKQTGRTFSRIQTVNVPPDTAGTLASDGTADPATVIKAVNDAFSPRFSQIKLNVSASGNDSAFNKLCTNNIDLVGATRPMSDAEVAACKKANVETMQLQLGTEAVVIVVNDNNKFATCLKTDEINKLFGLDSENKVKKWSDVNSAFPATDLLILGPTAGAAETDLLLGKVNKAIAPLRRNDLTTNDDPLYRAAGTANVGDAVTYMTFAQFQKVTAKVHTVGVDAGKGCVDATEANIKNGTYLLTETQYVVFNVNSFVRPEVKAFVWYFLSDDALSVVAKQGLIGTDTAGFTTARDTALASFAKSAPVVTQATPVPGAVPPPVSGAPSVTTP